VYDVVVPRFIKNLLLSADSSLLSVKRLDALTGAMSMCLTDRNNAVRVAALEVLLELLARPEGTAPFDPMVSY